MLPWHVFIQDNKWVQTGAHLFAVDHLRTDCHTGDNILNHYNQHCGEVRSDQRFRSCCHEQRPNIVAGLRAPPRFDFACHRLHTVSNDSYKQTHNQFQRSKEYEDAPVFSTHLKQTTLIQDTFPASTPNQRLRTEIWNKSAEWPHKKVASLIDH